LPKQCLLLHIITSLGGFFNNSKKDIQAILRQIFNLNISLGLISISEWKVSNKLENKYKELAEQAEKSQYLHLDETSSKLEREAWVVLGCSE
jgi:hypothetical protein